MCVGALREDTKNGCEADYLVARLICCYDWSMVSRGKH